MQSIIVGVLGRIGGGKGTAARYLHEKYGFHIISMGDMVRDEAVKRGIKKTRENLQKLSTGLRLKYGQDYFCKQALSRIQKQKIERVIIDGIRSTLEYKFWKENVPYFVLIRIDADKKIRFERLKKRGGSRAPRTWTDFLDQEKGEDKLYPGSFDQFLSLSDYNIENNSTGKVLQNNLDILMHKLKIFK